MLACPRLTTRVRQRKFAMQLSVTMKYHFHQRKLAINYEKCFLTANCNYCTSQSTRNYSHSFTVKSLCRMQRVLFFHGYNEIITPYSLCKELFLFRSTYFFMLMWTPLHGTGGIFALPIIQKLCKADGTEDFVKRGDTRGRKNLAFHII